MDEAKSKYLVVATRNAGKAREFKELLGDSWRVETLLDLPKTREIVEDGDTFDANARKKALEISRECDAYVLGDDSGLEVDALNGAPGVYSARYAGEPKDDRRNLEKLLAELGENACRGAQFHCVLALARKGEVLVSVSGICRGNIAHAPAGYEGFGYDPVFIPEGFETTFAQMKSAEKHALSHRGKALQRFSEWVGKNVV